MLWIDNDFDQNDQLARTYMKYQDRYYDKGTKVKIKGPNGPVVATFLGWRYQGKGCFEPEDDSVFSLYNNYSFSAANKFILEIIEPVYPQLQLIPIKRSNDRDKPPEWDVEVIRIWYIAIMVLATIFRARWIIWIVCTLVFLLWKNGFLNGGNKE